MVVVVYVIQVMPSYGTRVFRRQRAATAWMFRGSAWSRNDAAKVDFPPTFPPTPDVQYLAVVSHSYARSSF